MEFMALTFDELKKLMAGAGLPYFLDPHQPVLVCLIPDQDDTYQVAAILDAEHGFLQLRTVNLFQCIAEHVHAVPVLKVIGEFNYRARFIKLGWEPLNGEIAAYGDLFIFETKPTQEQFNFMLGAFLQQLHQIYPRLKQVLETGQETEPQKPEEAGLDRI